MPDYKGILIVMAGSAGFVWAGVHIRVFVHIAGVLLLLFTIPIVFTKVSFGFRIFALVILAMLLRMIALPLIPVIPVVILAAAVIGSMLLLLGWPKRRGRTGCVRRGFARSELAVWMGGRSAFWHHAGAPAKTNSLKTASRRIWGQNTTGVRLWSQFTVGIITRWARVKRQYILLLRWWLTVRRGEGSFTRGTLELFAGGGHISTSRFESIQAS